MFENGLDHQILQSISHYFLSHSVKFLSAVHCSTA